MDTTTLSFFADDNVISAADDVVVSPSKARPASPTTPIGAEREKYRIIKTLMSGNGSVDFTAFYERRFVFNQPQMGLHFQS